MISSNRPKLILVVSLAILSSNACRFWSGNSTKTDPESPVAEVQTTVPFETKVPETFQAEIVISNYVGGKKTKRRYFLAKKGDKSLVVFDYGTTREKANLQTDEKTGYLINKNQKTLEKLTHSKSAASNNQLKNFLTTKWLNEKVGAEFENLGATDNLMKFRVTLAESEKTEIIVFIDDRFNIPVKQEFYSLVASARVLAYAIEVKDVKTEVDDNTFAIPSDYEEKPASAP